MTNQNNPSNNEQPRRCACGKANVATPQQNPRAAAAGKCVPCYDISVWVEMKQKQWKAVSK
jgi:hypothetical protein